jgi:hypothetical protein
LDTNVLPQYFQTDAPASLTEVAQSIDADPRDCPATSVGVSPSRAPGGALLEQEAELVLKTNIYMTPFE